ncbi:MAG: hypothetical protein ACI8ZM_003832 [Crocinitomix sp.]|jgi:hypothetical protein
MGEGYFFKTDSFDVKAIRTEHFDITPFGELLSKKSLEKGVEYYFTEAAVVVKNKGISSGMSQKRLRVGELIKTENGWRISKGLGWG